jgi:hypothetical protein
LERRWVARLRVGVYGRLAVNSGNGRECLDATGLLVRGLLEGVREEAG